MAEPLCEGNRGRAGEVFTHLPEGAPAALANETPRRGLDEGDGKVNFTAGRGDNTTGDRMTNPHASKPYPSRMTIVRLASAAVFLLLGSGAGSAASFDGHWSVVIITESGSCDPAYRYRLRIQNGVVHYDGEADVTVSGKVDPNGAVRVSVARGQQRADGAGRLGGDAGSGTWSGASTADRCRGRWEAERR